MLFLAAGLADRTPEELRRPERRIAFLALHRKRGRDQSVAAGAAMANLAATLRAGRRQLRLVLDEEPGREPAAETERDPIAERFAPLLLNPVAFCLDHGSAGLDLGASAGEGSTELAGLLDVVQRRPHAALEQLTNEENSAGAHRTIQRGKTRRERLDRTAVPPERTPVDGRREEPRWKIERTQEVSQRTGKRPPLSSAGELGRTPAKPLGHPIRVDRGEQTIRLSTARQPLSELCREMAESGNHEGRSNDEPQARWEHSSEGQAEDRCRRRQMKLAASRRAEPTHDRAKGRPGLVHLAQR